MTVETKKATLRGFDEVERVAAHDPAQRAACQRVPPELCKATPCESCPAHPRNRTSQIGGTPTSRIVGLRADTNALPGPDAPLEGR